MSDGSHRVSWLVRDADGAVHQVDADWLEFPNGAAVFYRRFSDETIYVAVAFPAGRWALVDVMSQISGYASQRALLSQGTRPARASKKRVANDE